MCIKGECICVKGECMCVKGEYMYVRGECVCVREGQNELCLVRPLISLLFFPLLHFFTSEVFIMFYLHV